MWATRRQRQVARGAQSARDAAERILNEAFGDMPWREEIDRAPAARRPHRFVELYMERLKRSGATHVLKFSVRNPRDQHVFYLVHASKHPRAYQKMKEAIRTASRRQAVQAGGLPALEFLTDTDVTDVARRVAAHFAGQANVPWTDAPTGSESVQDYAIRHTEALYADLPALKRRLAEFGYRASGRRAAYTFPAAH